MRSFAVRLSAWVPPGIMVNAVLRVEGMMGVLLEEAGRKRIRWSREGAGVGIAAYSPGGDGS